MARKKKELTLEQLTKILDKVPKVVDVTIYGALAYLGYKSFGGICGALFGPVALKLAQANNMAAGAAGVAGLATLGVSHALGIDFQGMVEAILDPTKAFVDGQLVDKEKLMAPKMRETFPFDLYCEEGYKLVRGPSAAVCVPIEEGKGEVG